MHRGKSGTKRDRADEPGEDRELIWKRKFDSGNRQYEEETEITVVRLGTQVRFEVYQITQPPELKRAKHNYVLFRLTAHELETILRRAREDEEAEA